MTLDYTLATMIFTTSNTNVINARLSNYFNVPLSRTVFYHLLVVESMLPYILIKTEILYLEILNLLLQKCSLSNKTIEKQLTIFFSR